MWATRRFSNCPTLGLRNEQMSVFGHRYKSIDPKLIECARPLQSDDKRLPSHLIYKVR